MIGDHASPARPNPASSDPGQSDPGRPDWAGTVLATHRGGKCLGGGAVLVSVVVPYFERPAYLLRTLAAVRAQGAQCIGSDRIELIVINDGGADRHSLARDLPDEVIYLWQRRNGFGAARARNTGAKLANGRYLLFLDPDILIGDGYLDAALAGFAAHGGQVLQTGYIWDYFYPGCVDPRVEFGVWDEPDRPCARFLHLASGTMAISRELFLRAGGFDEDLIYGGWEDMEFGHRVGQLAGAAMVYNSGMECRHLAHPPSARRAAPELSLEICRIKHPDFYADYVRHDLR